jgi:outer membrane receptor protein involved in Fe transport
VVRRLQKGGWEAQVRVQNVLDQRVTTGTGNAGTSPRRFSASIERRF